MAIIFSRRELLATTSKEEQAEIRNLLKTNKIRFFEKTVDALGAQARRFGTTDQDLKFDHQSIFYVHKLDYEKAKELTHAFPRNLP